MKVLSIDPGPTCGVVLVEKIKNGCIRRYKDILDEADIPKDRFISLIPSLVGLDTMVLIENISNYGHPVGKDVFDTVRLIGYLQCCFHSIGKEVRLYNRKDIVYALTGTRTAKDSFMYKYLRGLLGVLGNCYVKKDCRGCGQSQCPMHGLKNDSRAALALAVAYLENPNLKEYETS